MLAFSLLQCRRSDLIAAGDPWRQLQVGDRPMKFGPRRHLCLGGRQGLTSFYVMFYSQHCLGHLLDCVRKLCKTRGSRFQLCNHGSLCPSLLLPLPFQPLPLKYESVPTWEYSSLAFFSLHLGNIWKKLSISLTL